MNLDRKTLIAVVLCGLLLVFYQPILRWAGLSAYLDRGSRAPATTDTIHAPPPLRPSAPVAGAASAPPSSFVPPVTPGAQLFASPPGAGTAAVEHLYSIETPLLVAHFSDLGARLISVELKHYASALGLTAQAHRRVHLRKGEAFDSGDRVVLAGGPLFGMDLGSGADLRSLAGATFAVSESADAAGLARALTFTATDSNGAVVRQTWRARPDRYALDLEVEISGPAGALRIPDYSLSLRSWPLVTEGNLLADERSLRATSMLGQDVHKDHTQGLTKTPKSYDGNVAWAAVQSRYFMGAIAVVDGSSRGVLERGERRPLTPEQVHVLPAGARADQEVAINSLRMSMPGGEHPVQRFLVYVGPVDFFQLSGLKLQLERAVDLGWVWVTPFSRALLQLLKWLYGLIPNYGIAIAVLATLVRVALHPLNMASMKSQRSLVKIQPEMERIREKHKNDPQATNAAILALYRENKVNPAGGCLPMIVQMPLFFALYSVLYNAIELRQAPFLFWIGDLSAPDLLMNIGPLPLRLLPLLMTGSGFLTQALTPTDPSQKPTMYLMNVFMLVFFYNLPSGLVLYWTVMNLLTAAQQWLAMRQDGAASAPEGAIAAEVVSPAVRKRRR